MLTRLWPWLLLGLALLPALLVHPSPPPAPSKAVTIFSEVIFQDPGTLDPALARSSAEWAVDTNLFPGLFRVNRAGRVVPDLVKTYTVKGSVLAMTLHRRMLANGQPLTAEVVAGALARPLWPSVHSSAAMAAMAEVKGSRQVVAGTKTFLTGVTVTGRYALTITYNKSVRPAFLKALANPAMGIVPVSDQKQGGPDWQFTNLFGAGGYRLTDWNPGQRLSFVRDQTGSGPKHVELVEYPSFQEAVLSFTNHVVDAVPVTPGELTRLSAALVPQVRYLPLPGILSLYIRTGAKNTARYGISDRQWVKAAFDGRVPGAGGHWPQTLSSGGAMTVWVNQANPLAVQLGATLSRLTRNRVTIRQASASTIQKMAAQGKIGAYLGTVNWFKKGEAMAVAPMGTFWLLSKTIADAQVYANGALNWHTVRLTP